MTSYLLARKLTDIGREQSDLTEIVEEVWSAGQLIKTRAGKLVVISTVQL